MTKIEKKLASTSITMDCFEMGDFKPMYLYDYTDYSNITDVWRKTIEILEDLRLAYNETKDKKYFKELIRLLPNSYKGFSNIQKENETLKWEQKQILEDNENYQKENEELKQQIEQLKAQYKKQRNRRIDELQKAIAEKNSVIEKMKNCQNCKHHSFWGDELKCNFLSYDEELECMKDKHEWELAE